MAGSNQRAVVGAAEIGATREPEAADEPIDRRSIGERLRDAIAEEGISAEQLLEGLIHTLVEDHVSSEMEKAGRRPGLRRMMVSGGALQEVLGAVVIAQMKTQETAERFDDEGAEENRAISDEQAIDGMISRQEAEILRTLNYVMAAAMDAGERAAGLGEGNEAAEDGAAMEAPAARIRLVRD